MIIDSQKFCILVGFLPGVCLKYLGLFVANGTYWFYNVFVIFSIKGFVWYMTIFWFNFDFGSQIVPVQKNIFCQ